MAVDGRVFFGSSVDDILAANSLESDAIIRPGDLLLIPVREVPQEVIGAKEYSIEQCCIIAAESRGHMQACLQAAGAR